MTATFDRCVIINLPRRVDRLLSASAEIHAANWPFRKPEVFQGMDVAIRHLRAGWRGCLMSHALVLVEAICAGAKSVLVMEDDVCFVEGFAEKALQFMEDVPDDWDQIMFGGQHLSKPRPEYVAPGVLCVTSCERTHCYAIRGRFMEELWRRWGKAIQEGEESHCDWIMARDPAMQPAHKVYAPDPFLAGQIGGLSDVNGGTTERRFFNLPLRAFSVALL